MTEFSLTFKLHFDLCGMAKVIHGNVQDVMLKRYKIK